MEGTTGLGIFGSGNLTKHGICVDTVLKEASFLATVKYMDLH